MGVGQGGWGLGKEDGGWARGMGVGQGGWGLGKGDVGLGRGEEGLGRDRGWVKGGRGVGWVVDSGPGADRDAGADHDWKDVFVLVVSITLIFTRILPASTGQGK